MQALLVSKSIHDEMSKHTEQIIMHENHNLKKSEQILMHENPNLKKITHYISNKVSKRDFILYKRIKLHVLFQHSRVKILNRQAKTYVALFKVTMDTIATLHIL